MVLWYVKMLRFSFQHICMQAQIIPNIFTFNLFEWHESLARRVGIMFSNTTIDTHFIFAHVH